MANLTRTWRWERFDPDLGENRSLPEAQRFSLEVASGLTAAQLQDVFKAIASVSEAAEGDVPAVYSQALETVVRVKAPPPGQLHTIAGKPIATLKDYIDVILGMAGVYNVRELALAVREFNSISGTERLFWARQSGGSPTTPDQSAALSENQTGDR